MPQRSSTLAKHMTLKDRPFRHNDIVFWTAYDVYKYVFEEYSRYVRAGEMTEEGITAVAIHDALLARCRYLSSMREDVRSDPHVMWGEPDIPDLSAFQPSRARDALSLYWKKYVPTAATACLREAKRRYDRRTTATR